MKRSMYLFLALVGLFCCAGQFLRIAAQAPAHETRHVFTPDSIPWGPAPRLVRPGRAVRWLEGDPTAASASTTPYV